jgi:uncharacterized membrane protein
MNIHAKKFYDILIDEGHCGGNAYTAILSNDQKHQLAMLNSAQETRDALTKLLNEAKQSDVYYEQCEDDIKKYINKKGLFWSQLMYVFCCLASGTLFTFDSSKSNWYVYVPILVITCLGIVIANTKMDKYVKQRQVMAWL